MDYADLRTAIYDHLVAEIIEVGGRVFWGWTADADTEKPFLVMMMIGESPSINTPLGLFMTVEILTVGEQGNILAIDPIADHVISALHQVDINTPDGRTIRLEYRRESRIDFWSEELRGNVIDSRFTLPTDFWTG